MSDLWGSLGQAKPAAGILTNLYTVPVGKHASAEVVICNQGAATSFRIAHAINGASDTAAQYLIYDLALAVGEAKTTARFTLKGGDILRVQSASGTVSFNFNGIEETD